MWSLTSEVTGAVKYLWKGKEYTIGRKNTDVVINDDSSISRNHAKVFVKDNLNLMLVDLKSKYGTFYNNERIQHETEINIIDETIIKFGQINSTFRVKKIIVSVATSNISPNDRKELLKNIEFLNGTFMSDWSRDCTHLTISVVKLTLKVLCALTLGQPIVNIKYWSDFVERVKNNNDLPNPNDYLPKVSETLLSKNIPLVYDPSRKTLFSNKTFIFFAEKTIQNTKDAILVCGGEALLWKDARYDSSWLTSRKPEYIFIEENPRNASQTNEYKTFYEAIAALESLGKRPITLQEIALAILNSTCEKDCNPNFNRVANIQPMETKLEKLKLLAKETQNTQSSMGSEVIINESAGCSMNFDSQCHTLRTEIGEGLNSSNKRAVDEPDATVLRKRPKQDMEVQKSQPLVLEEVKKPEQQKKLNFSQVSTDSTKSSSSKNTFFQNPFMSKKRKAETEIEKPIKKPPQPIEVDKNKTHEKAPKKKIEKSKQIPLNLNVSVVTVEFGWTSRSVVEIKNDEEETNEVQIKKEVDDRDVEKLLWIESMKDKTITKFEKLEISRRTMDDSSRSVNEHNKSTKNFKRFRKTQNKHVQSFVVPTEEFKIIVCSRDFYNEHPLDDNEYESDHEFNDVAVHKSATSLNITRTSTTLNTSMNTTSTSKKRKYDFFQRNAKK